MASSNNSNERVIEFDDNNNIIRYNGLLTNEVVIKFESDVFFTENRVGQFVSAFKQFIPERFLHELTFGCPTEGRQPHDEESIRKKIQALKKNAKKKTPLQRNALLQREFDVRRNVATINKKATPIKRKLQTDLSSTIQSNANLANALEVTKEKLIKEQQGCLHGFIY